MQSKRRIICFTDSLGSGGAQRQMVGLACMLKEKGYDVSVVVYHDQPFYQPLLDEQNIVTTIIPGENKLKRVWSLYKFFRQNKGATIIAYQEAPSLITCFLRPFIKCRKLIVSERNTTQRTTWREKLRFWYYRLADYVVPNSYSQAKFICDNFPGLKTKVVPITNFVDVEKFKPDTRIQASANGAKTLVVVGSQKPEKNFHRFVDAVKILVADGIELRVNWYGILPDYIDNHREYVHTLGLGEIVKVYEPVKGIDEVYKTVDLFCLPSLFEGFPNVLCEAISTGLLVACSNVCDNPYIVSQIKGGVLFDPYDVKDMADKLKELVAISEQDRTQYSAENREIAVQIFSKQSFVEKYCELI